MNFIKNSIFCHQPEEEEAYREEPENQMLAVWGSPGCGKTTVASKLAMRLAMQKQDVALLLCDMNTPMLPCICPPGELEEEHSLGSILAAAHVTENLVRHHCITHKKLRHLTILGMRTSSIRLRVMFGRMKRAHIWSRCWGIPYSRFHIPEKWKSRCCKETCLKSWD